MQTSIGFCMFCQKIQFLQTKYSELQRLPGGCRCGNGNVILTMIYYPFILTSSSEYSTRFTTSSQTSLSYAGYQLRLSLPGSADTDTVVYSGSLDLFGSRHRSLPEVRHIQHSPGIQRGSMGGTQDPLDGTEQHHLSDRLGHKLSRRQQHWNYSHSPSDLSN